MKSEKKKPTFEEAYTRLSEIVETLESGEGTLTELTESFEEGVALSKVCAGHLDSIEQKVEILLGDGGNEDAVPFDDE